MKVSNERQAEMAAELHGMQGTLECDEGRWGRKGAGALRNRGGPLGPQGKQGPLEGGQGRCGHTMGGVPWNAGREAVALT